MINKEFLEGVYRKAIINQDQNVILITGERRGMGSMAIDIEKYLEGSIND